MTLKTISACALAALLSATFVGSVMAQDAPTVPDPAIASMTPEQMVKARQDAMIQDGKILRDAGKVTGDDAVNAAMTLVTNFTNFPALFPEGSIVGKSHALPAIWEHWDTFTGLLTQGRAQAVVMLDAAKAGDTAAFTAAVQPFGKICGQCHQQFRAPENE